MGQEAYAMFPMLAEASARAAALRQTTAQGATTFGQQQEGQNIFGNTIGAGGPPQVPGGAPLPGMPPDPGQASVPNIRVPQPAAAGGGFAPYQSPAKSAGGQDVPAGSTNVAVPPVAAPSPGAGAPVPAPGQPSPPQAQAPQQGQPGSVSLDNFMAAARKKFPNASGQALAQAANYYLPFMTEEDQARLRELLYTNNAAYHQGQLGVAETNAQTKAADVGSKIDYRAQALKLKEEYMNRADARAAATRQQAAAIAAQRTDIATQQQTRLIQEAITRAQTAYSVSLNNNGLAFQNDPDQLKAHNDQAEATYNATLDNLNAQAQKMSAKGKQSMNTPVPGSPEWSAKRVALGMSATPQYGGANA